MEQTRSPVVLHGRPARSGVAGQGGGAMAPGVTVAFGSSTAAPAADPAAAAGQDRPAQYVSHQADVLLQCGPKG